MASFLHTIDGPVVLVGHSYGGSVITEAAASSPNVKALVFVDAYAPEVGESASTLNGDGSVVLTLAEDQLFDTVPDPEAPDGSTNLLLKQDVFLNNFASPLGQVAMSNLDVALHSTSASVDHAASRARGRPLSLFATSIYHRKPSSDNGFGWV